MTELYGVTVLVVEDDDDTREVLKVMLEMCGARVVCCDDNDFDVRVGRLQTTTRGDAVRFWQPDIATTTCGGWSPVVVRSRSRRRRPPRSHAAEVVSAP